MTQFFYFPFHGNLHCLSSNVCATYGIVKSAIGVMPLTFLMESNPLSFCLLDSLTTPISWFLQKPSELEIQTCYSKWLCWWYFVCFDIPFTV